MADWTPDIERLQSYDDEEWMRVEREYCGRLMAYVGRRVDDSQAREDVVQEVFLGAVRGIGSFDAIYTFEQYLFGICRNRTIDHLRRRSARGVGAAQESSESLPGLDDLLNEEETPSGVVSERDLASQGQALLVEVLREWVQETWQLGEFKRLMVIEALFHEGRRAFQHGETVVFRQPRIAVPEQRIGIGQRGFKMFPRKLRTVGALGHCTYHSLPHQGREIASRESHCEFRQSYDICGSNRSALQGRRWRALLPKRRWAARDSFLRF